MVSSPNTSYQPSVAYQGGQVNTPEQQPRSGQVQPRQAPAADTQRGDQRSLASQDEKDHASYDGNRGRTVDVKA